MKNPEAAELGEETGKSLPVIVWKALEDYLSRQKSETRDTTVDPMRVRSSGKRHISSHTTHI
jgi:hypothetical protein